MMLEDSGFRDRDASQVVQTSEKQPRAMSDRKSGLSGEGVVVASNPAQSRGKGDAAAAAEVGEAVTGSGQHSLRKKPNL